MTLKSALAAVLTAGLLTGCVSTGAVGPADTALTPLAGEPVSAGVPCDHLLSSQANSVAGCEGYIPLSKVSSEEAKQISILNTRFAAEVQPVVHFEFGKDKLTPQALATIAAQADWMRRFVHLRFSVYGHTDLVDTETYNFDLAKRRAEAVVSQLMTHGVSRDQLDALVSYGETRPMFNTPGPEAANRRTVTEVTGYMTTPRLRARDAIDCSLIAPAYLASYPVCIADVARSLPPYTPPAPPVIDTTTTITTGTGTQTTTTSASYFNDGVTEISDTSGSAGGGTTTTSANVTTTGGRRSVTLGVNGVNRTYETDLDGGNPREVTP